MHGTLSLISLYSLLCRDVLSVLRACEVLSCDKDEALKYLWYCKKKHHKFLFE
jgi:hypothetical protein